jgi:hypothetical protein
MQTRHVGQHSHIGLVLAHVAEGDRVVTQYEVLPALVDPQQESTLQPLGPGQLLLEVEDPGPQEPGRGRHVTELAPGTAHVAGAGQVLDLVS